MSYQRDEAFRTGAFVRFPLPSGAELVYLPFSGRVETLSCREIDHLLRCSEFRTLDQHAQQICKATPNSECGAILSSLARLADMRALFGKSELIKCLEDSANVEADTGCQICTLAIPTCGRPAELLRCIQSYLDHTRHYDRHITIYIADDTRCPSASDMQRLELARVSEREGCEIRYCGYEQKVSFIETLAERGIPESVARFALLGLEDAETRAGANRNAILLHSLGQAVLSVDDDTVCVPTTMSTPYERGILCLGSEADPTERWFFSDRNSALESVAPLDVDVFSAHERFLGRSLSVVTAEALSGGFTIDTHKMCQHLLTELMSGKGKILATYNGLVGDCGLSTRRAFMFSGNAKTKNRLAESPTSLRVALECRETVRQALSPTIVHGLQNNQTMFVGLDNRLLLPPFFPACRNQDGVFEATLGHVIGDACTGLIPLSLVHSPLDSREYVSDGVERITVSEIAMAAISCCHTGLADRPCAIQIQNLGRAVVEIGSLSDGLFAEWLKAVLCGRASMLVNALENILAREDRCPPYWAEEVERLAELFAKSALEERAVLPRDLPHRDALGLAEGVRATRALVTQFGELLCWWPEITETTRKLAESGVPGFVTLRSGAIVATAD